MKGPEILSEITQRLGLWSKSTGGTHDDEEETKSRRGPAPCRRQNKMPQADLMNWERLVTKLQEVFICPKEENSLKVGLPLWTWYYKKD